MKDLSNIIAWGFGWSNNLWHNSWLNFFFVVWVAKVRIDTGGDICLHLALLLIICKAIIRRYLKTSTFPRLERWKIAFIIELRQSISKEKGIGKHIIHWSASYVQRVGGILIWSLQWLDKVKYLYPKWCRSLHCLKSVTSIVEDTFGSRFWTPKSSTSIWVLALLAINKSYSCIVHLLLY